MFFLKHKNLLLILCIVFLISCTQDPQVSAQNNTYSTLKVQPFGVGETPNIPIEGKTGKPYVVRGDTYHPLLSSEGFLEEGIASWYGPGFHGKKTASGETYNQNGLTAAHKYLPMGTYVYVTNLENGRVIRLKINDRGPYKYNRVIDLSQKAAETLGFLDAGTAQVRVSVDKNPKAPRKTSSTPITGQISSNAPSNAIAPLEIQGGNIYINVVKYTSKNEANQAIKSLEELGLTYRVYNSSIHAGPFVSLSVAERMLAVIKIRYNDAYIIK